MDIKFHITIFFIEGTVIDSNLCSLKICYHPIGFLATCSPVKDQLTMRNFDFQELGGTIQLLFSFFIGRITILNGF